VKREGVPFEAIPAAGVHGVGPRTLPGNLWQLARGLLAARRILRRFQPQVLFFTGGYLAVPMALAARLPGLGFRRPRRLLYIPDIEPGLALKTLVRFADHVALTADATRAFLPARVKASVSGYPLRAGLSPMPVEAAQRVFGLRADLPTALIMGGSKGARSINRAVLAVLPALLDEIQIIHLSGSLDWAEVEAAHAALSPEQAARYHAFPYLHEQANEVRSMSAAFSAASLIVCRAGASTLGELPLFGLPAILVPYPHAWRYQRTNADYLAQRGAALVLEDAELSLKLLLELRALLGDQARLNCMRQAMGDLAQPSARQQSAVGILANLLQTLAGQTNETGPSSQEGSAA